MAREVEQCPSQRILEYLQTMDTADLDPAGKIDPAGSRRQTTREKIRLKKDRWKDPFCFAGETIRGAPWGANTQGGQPRNRTAPPRMGSITPTGRVPRLTHGYGDEKDIDVIYQRRCKRITALLESIHLAMVNFPY